MYEIKRRVSASDVGADGCQTLVSMVTMMQNCSLFWMESEPEVQAYLHDHGILMMVISRQLDIVRHASYGERLSVQTSIYNFRGHLGYRNTFIYDEEHVPVAKSWAIGAFVDKEAGKLIKLPKELVDGITYDEKLEMEYLGRKIIAPDCELEPLAPFKVQRNDIDLYKHVNNAQYVRMAGELLPEGFDPHRMRVEYRSQARLGDTIYPFIAVPAGEPKNVYLVLQNEEGLPFSVFSYV